jgi:hypothetical protein
MVPCCPLEGLVASLLRLLYEMRRMTCHDRSSISPGDRATSRVKRNPSEGAEVQGTRYDVERRRPSFRKGNSAMCSISIFMLTFEGTVFGFPRMCSCAM